jgi:hypothetical protein
VDAPINGLAAAVNVALLHEIEKAPAMVASYSAIIGE